MPTPIEILTLADARYFPGLRATAMSMALYAKDPSRLVFNVIDGGIPEASQQDLQERLEAVHPEIVVKFIQPSDGLFEGLPAYKGSKLTYIRLFLPELFPQLDKMLFCDSDTLWLAPVEDAWNLLGADDAIVAVRDPSERTRNSENAWYREQGLEPPGEAYFCAAIAVLNLQWMREHRIAERAGQFVSKYPSLRFADQTIMNHLMRGQVRDLPVYLHTLSRTDHGGRLELPRVIHYAGELPWVRGIRTQTISDMELIWHHFADLAIHGRKDASLAALYPKPVVWLKRLLYTLNRWPGITGLYLYIGRKLLRINEASLAKLIYYNPIRRKDMKKAYASIQSRVLK
jgi:lipopolysaccharide biosynthesis glycosyltransferase